VGKGWGDLGGKEYCTCRDGGADNGDGESSLDLPNEMFSGDGTNKETQINEIRPEMSFEVLSNPEFLSEGDAVNNLLKPERVVIGSTMTDNGHAAVMALANVYRSWVDPAKIQTMSSSSAELAKLAANAMLAQRISSINAISSICERSGADVADIQLALGSDSRIGSACLRAGIGFGGSCLKKDIIGLVHLAETLNLPNIGEYWLQVLRMNHAQSRRFAERVVSRLEGSLVDKKLAILGWAFKKGTSDMRETRSAHVLKELLKRSVKDVAVFDPGCDPADVQDEVQSTKRFVAWKSERPHSNVVVHENPYTACQGADAVLILTDWDQFRCLPQPKRPLVPSREAGAEDALGSPSYFSCTGGAPSEIGLSLSKLSIRDDKSLGKTNRSVRNTFSRLKPEPPCPSDCKDCRKMSTAWSKLEGIVDWKRISAAMKFPKWVFDGRNVLNIDEMEKLGFKVEAVGKASIWKPFEGDACSTLIDQPKQ
jgi:UDPglucose 6-dehydrogenase